MPERAPLVAVCMATFEPDPALLERQIDSIRAQTHENWVCLISDDGSAAERLQRLRELTAEDPRFTLAPAAERLGFYLNFERALKLVPAEAAYVALADQDDRWYPEKLAELLAACRGARLAYSDMRIVDGAGAVVSETFWRGRRNNHTNLASLLLSNTVTGAASLFPRELLELALPFPEPIGDSFHDQWIASVALATGAVAYVDKPLYDYVQHGDAARGHEAAMRPWSPGRLLNWRQPRRALREIGVHGQRSYENNVRRIALAARTIEARAGGTLAADKAKAVRRAARLDQRRAPVGWLGLRSLRRLTGHNETMGIELSLLTAIGWRRFAGARGETGAATAASRPGGSPPSVPTVLHILPHPGGGAETYIDLLEGLDGFRHERVALSVTRSRLLGVPSTLARRRRILRNDADLVHVHGDMAAMLAAPALRGRPLVITTHGLHRLRRSEGVSARLVRRRLAAAVAASARAICIASDEREDLAAALPLSLRERLVVVPNGVPVAAADAERRARVRQTLGLGEGEVAVLFAAQLEQRKDPLGAAAAVEAVRARGAEIVLLLAGGGPLEAEVRARASAAVRVLGHRDDLDDLYAAADVFLLPSHREGMSFALLEAMAHGLAPVVADGTGNAETVGAAGVVFPAGDLGAMSNRLAELAADPEERRRRGDAARERIRAELNLERFLSGTKAQYEAALAAGGPPQGA